MENTMSVEKVALITAGGSGMGADAARRLAADGFRIGILSSSGKGEVLGKELGGFGVTGSTALRTILVLLYKALRTAGGASMSSLILLDTALRGQCWRFPMMIGMSGWKSIC